MDLVDAAEELDLDCDLSIIDEVKHLLGVSIPSFWLATLLLLFTSRVFGWVPPLTSTSFFDDPLTNLSQFALPAISIATFCCASFVDAPRCGVSTRLGAPRSGCSFGNGSGTVLVLG